MNSNREKITNIVMVGVFAAVLAVLSQISFPLPSGIPVTLQTFAVALCGYALGCKRGTLAVLVYIVLGAVGLPVFANFSGGFGSLVGLAGGYIYGFLPMAALCGLGTKMPHRVLAVVLGVAGLAICAARFSSALSPATARGRRSLWPPCRISSRTSSPLRRLTA